MNLEERRKFIRELLSRPRPVLRPSEKLARLEWLEKMESSGHPFVITSRKQSAHAGEEIIAEGLTLPDYPPCEFIEEHFTILDPEDKKEKE